MLPWKKRSTKGNALRIAHEHKQAEECAPESSNNNIPLENMNTLPDGETSASSVAKRTVMLDNIKMRVQRELSARESERLDCVAAQLVKCYSDTEGAKNNRLVGNNHLNDNIDVFSYDEPAEEKIVEITCFPFVNASFDPAALGVSVSIVQIPQPMRGIEPVEFAGVEGREGDG